MNIEKWRELKNRGSEHYKKSPDEVEPIDLYAAGGCFRDFAVGNIIKYAFRNRAANGFNPQDIDKIIHYAELLKAYME